jgi:HAD superfamily hydrolase (TIGR01549 family)
MTIKAVVFDLDGTIASFNLDYMIVRADVRGFLIKNGVPGSILSTSESIFEMLKKAEVSLRNNGKSQKAVDEVRHKALAIAEKYELEAAKTTDLTAGVVETLRFLKKMGLKIGLCTINSQKSTDYILKRFGIIGFFDAVISRNKVRHVKPSGEHLETTLEALEVNPREAILVGDGITDMQCARELKVFAVGLPTGIASKRQLIVSGANYLITSITDLPTLIRWFNKIRRTRYPDGKD